MPTVAMGDILYHHPDRRILQDVVTCIRRTAPSTRPGSGWSAMPTASSRTAGEMARLFERHPEAVARTGEIVARCRFSARRAELPVPERKTEGRETAQETLDG